MTTSHAMRRTALPRARKRFGQHFLTDASVVDSIAAILAVGPDDHVIEIGPGHGALTAPLAAACDNLTVIEVDRDLAAILRRRFPRVDVIEADVLRTDFVGLARSRCLRRASATGCSIDDERSRGALAGGSVRVVGNLPYNIAAPIMMRLFDDCVNGLALRDAHFMLQAEMADRLAAPPGTRARGRLSVIAQYHCRIESLLTVDAAAFSPRPKVTSKFVRLTPRAPALLAQDMAALHTVVRTAFGQRRKRLGNALQSLDLDLPALGLDPGSRAQEMGVSDFVAMANQVHRRGV